MVGNVVDIAKEAIDHGKVSVPFLMKNLVLSNELIKVELPP